MKKNLILVLSFICNAVFSQVKTDGLLNKLSSVLDNRDIYVKEKLERIDQFEAELNSASSKDHFHILEKIFDEYKSFIYDSAFHYALKLQKLANQSNDPVKICKAKINVSFALVSSGLLYEAFDTLKTVKLAGLPTKDKIEYYYLQARTCYDLADFVQNRFYGDQYAMIGASYVDSALILLPDKSVKALILKGLKLLHLRDMKAAGSAYEDLIKNYNLSDHESAIAASTLSFIYLQRDDKKESSKEMLIRAVMADVKGCTKETVAIRKLAETLYHNGDIENAYKYIKIAMEDAEFYGARHRKMQVASVFPLIEGAQLSKVETRRKSLLLYSSILTVIFLLIIRQNKKTQSAKRTISNSNESLTRANALLKEINNQLTEANKIKEEYLWYYFNTTAEYIAKLDSLKKKIELNVTIKKLEEIRFIAYNINIKRERENLYHNFDKVFLRLFPDFVKEFNSLLSQENKIVLKDGKLLNTELRIFALIRLGIHDHEKIAKILDYSITTIYTYKTKIKSRSIYSGEEFDKRILKIGAL